jgi:hypothetical protein
MGFGVTPGSVLGATLAVDWGIGFGATLEAVLAVVSGVALGASFGLAFGSTLGAVLAVVSGVALGATFGAAAVFMIAGGVCFCAVSGFAATSFAGCPPLALAKEVLSA